MGASRWCHRCLHAGRRVPERMRLCMVQLLRAAACLHPTAPAVQEDIARVQQGVVVMRA